MAITIKDIADYVDVSPSTVSKALNDYPGTAAETKSRVLAAARELGYYPMAAARDLRRGKTNRIGFLLGYSNTDIGEVAARLITGVVAAAELAGYNILLYPMAGDHLQRLTSVCKSGEVDGILLTGSEYLTEAIAILQKERFPYVVLNRYIEEPDVSFVTTDHYAVAVAAMEHLIELGHQRIAYLGRPTLGKIHFERLAGYHHALRAAQLPADDTLILSTINDPRDWVRAMQALLALQPPPTAVLAFHDQMAIECIQVVVEAGLKVPDDVAIVGSDDLYSAQVTRPALTTIHTPFVEMGRLAMEVLLRRLADPAAPPVRQILASTVIVRGSTVDTGTGLRR
ncbi:MAG: LacI family DNA-binding transcriptional regulator [Anaerolineales bacterium]|nr:LacI family DNA-binding transcriptional regulator [Anaerolineales bacterium]